MAPAKLAPCLATVAPPTANQSAIYRRASSKNGFPTLDGVTTLYELFSRSAEAHADLPALGRRPIGVSFVLQRMHASFRRLERARR